MPQRKRLQTRQQREDILRSLGKDPVEVRSKIKPIVKPTNAFMKKMVNGKVDHTILVHDRAVVVKELKHILIAMIIVVLLFVAIIVLDLKTPYIQKAGEILTNKVGF